MLKKVFFHNTYFHDKFIRSQVNQSIYKFICSQVKLTANKFVYTLIAKSLSTLQAADTSQILVFL